MLQRNLSILLNYSICQHQFFVIVSQDPFVFLWLSYKFSFTYDFESFFPAGLAKVLCLLSKTNSPLSLIFFYYFLIFHLFLICYFLLQLNLGLVALLFFSSSLQCKVSFGIEVFLLNVSIIIINFPLRIVFTISHNFSMLYFILSHDIFRFLISFLTNWFSGACCLISTYLSIFQFPLLLISSFTPLWSRKDA